VPAETATEMYRMILEKNEGWLGVVFRWD
jgi:hypothetical protein